DAKTPQLLVDVGVVDDLAGEVHAAVRKAAAGLVRVVHRAIDAVAEAELARQVDEETSGAVLIPGRADVVHQLTVIARGEHVGDLVFEVESLAEDQRRQRTSEAPPAGGVAGSTGD